MIKAEIVVDFPKWRTKIKSPNLYFKKKIRKISTIKLFKKKNFQFTLLLTNKTFIKKLNKKFRNKNRSTDVLSFPFYKKKQLKENLFKKKEMYLGDVVISINNIKNRNNKKEFFKELNKLWIHGLLHLFGYDHKFEKDYKKMKKIENKFYKSLTLNV